MPEAGYYWVKVPDMIPQIAQFDPSDEKQWFFTWGTYLWPDQIKIISKRLEPPWKAEGAITLDDGFYWVKVPGLGFHIAQYSPEFDLHERWSFTWGTYRWSHKVQIISEQLLPTTK